MIACTFGSLLDAYMVGVFTVPAIQGAVFMYRMYRKYTQ